ncbi:pseudouridine synthase [Aerococcus kribbianus]|uniref:Pseudouridine synthase n=1 Tax=Aerococcus kribbianus TaxID=2999064 RepID=A0A9X3FP23_9LACT|nr:MULTISPECIES: pseudouridine synthase [unclassified Aerococcus]MCZ0717088.1 pseudouridine synthase [Aerococcus sp. YH-aer221]MCZ0725376.1 pseudouridine synthase [Aerococcus sp. YH-aer222]
MRLDKYLSENTLYSRKEIKQLVKAKRVQVNGQVIKKADSKVNPDQDQVNLDGISIAYEPFIYYILNKPQGVVSATWDAQWPTVLDCLPQEDMAIYEPAPVGRLDKDTEGLLIITNDGQFNHQIVSPKRHVEKEYTVEVSELIPDSAIDDFQAGLKIDQGDQCLPAKLTIINRDKDREMSHARVTIREGKYHQVKRMFAAIGCQVTALKRIRIGKFYLPEDLGLGEYIKLSKADLEKEIY